MSTQKEYGDFQTPLQLASKVIDLLDSKYGIPDLVIEPTSGLGSFLEAAHEKWGGHAEYRGFEINPEYVSRALSRLGEKGIKIEQQDFFVADWRKLLSLPPGKRVLVVGNPPWVTNSSLGSLGSANLPEKKNFQGLRGFDARTGKSNFDISEWMLIRIIESLPEQGMVAMLCKTMTARKVLQHFWKTLGGLADSELYSFDAKAHFDVSVDACLFVSSSRKTSDTCAPIYDDISTVSSHSRFGVVDGRLVSDLRTYSDYRDLDGGSQFVWRSGIKHDAAKVMEFVSENGHLRNGFGEIVSIEPDYVYPLLKSSDLGNNRIKPRRSVLVTQQATGDSTDAISEKAPKTWQYLERNLHYFEARRSSIYSGRDKFSVFGIGEYSFSLWKVGISGLYKNTRFVVVPPVQERPVMLDDTCYFIPATCQEQAELIALLLNSVPSQAFLGSLVFADSKRPITSEILRRLSLYGIASRLGKSAEFERLVGGTQAYAQSDSQMRLMMERQHTYGHDEKP